MSIESVMPSNDLILCHPFLLLPSIFPSMRVFSNESALRIRWPKYWSFSFICQIYTHWRQSIIVNILQAIFPTPGWIPGLLHCRQNLYPLSHQGSLLVNMGNPRGSPGPCFQDLYLLVAETGMSTSHGNFEVEHDKWHFINEVLW